MFYEHSCHNGPIPNKLYTTEVLYRLYKIGTATFTSLLFQNSAFSTTNDEQYRQLYHPTENYRTLSYDTPTSRSPANNYSPASPVGLINPVMNGVTAPVQRTSGGNLGTIREESNSHQHAPHSNANSHAAKQMSSVKNHSFQDKGEKVTVGGERQKVTTPGNVATGDLLNGGMVTGGRLRNQGSQLSDSKSKVKSDQSIISSDNSQGELGIEGQGKRTGENVRRRSGEGPKFTISEGSDDSETSSTPPKGKFYI